MPHILLPNCQGRVIKFNYRLGAKSTDIDPGTMRSARSLSPRFSVLDAVGTITVLNQDSSETSIHVN